MLIFLGSGSIATWKIIANFKTYGLHLFAYGASSSWLCSSHCPKAEYIASWMFRKTLAADGAMVKGWSSPRLSKRVLISFSVVVLNVFCITGSAGGIVLLVGGQNKRNRAKNPLPTSPREI